MICGCTSPDKTDLLEARLRERELVLENYEQEIHTVQSQLSVAQREARILREEMKRSGKTPPAMEATAAIAAAETLQFNTLLTAGQNADSAPGDEKFHAIVVPYDATGNLVKVIGDVEFEAIDLSLPETRRTVGKWVYNPEQAQELWHAGFLSSGYRFVLPWKQAPAGKEILLHMKLITADGRELTASHTVKIDPPLQLGSASATPGLLTVPATAQEAHVSDETQQSVEVPEKKGRPPAVLDLFEEPVQKTAATAIVPISFEKKSEPVTSESSTNSPRPFPEGIKTSDNWTESSIPTLR